MREGVEEAHPVLARIRQQLAKLPLSQEDIAGVVPQLAAACRFMKVTDPQSRFFDFGSKINEVVKRFAADGLTTEGFLKTALKQPRLLTLSPDAIARHITGVVECFAAEGLTTGDYLKAALKQPALFYQSPATVAGNITGVVERFADDGLKTPDYLKVALKQPALFCYSPETIAGHITEVVERFAADGLKTSDYLKAALRQPALFYQSPATIAGNVTGVVEHFAGEGLKTSDYLKAALKQPSLFMQTPATVIGHFNLLMDLHRQRLLTFPGEGRTLAPGKSLQPLFAFLVKNPLYLTLADDNFTVRAISAQVVGERPKGTVLVRRTRRQVESQLTEALGHADQDVPVPKERSPQEGGNATRHARNVLLRALIREGIVKGTLER